MKPDIQATYEFFGLRVTGRGNGAWVKAQCPLLAHEDNNPSASINIDEGLWRCHSCAEGGDAYDIIKEREGVTGWTNLQRRAQEIAGDDSGAASRERGGSSLYSRGRKRKGAEFVPPWRRV